MFNYIGNRPVKLRGKIWNFSCKRYLSFKEAKFQILGHPTIQKHTKNIDKLEIENTDTLTECYHNFLSPELNKLDRKEVLELQTYVLEKSALFEFGISDFLMREIINSEENLDYSEYISETTLSNILKRNPGRRMTPLEYLGDLKKLNIDILEKNNKLMMFTLNKIMESSESTENEELVRHLTQAVYLFINLSQETLLSQFAEVNIHSLLNKIIDSNSTKLLELVLEKLLKTNFSGTQLFDVNSINTDTLTSYQQFLMTRFQVINEADSLDSELFLKYLKSVKNNGPFFKLTEGETLAQGVSEDEEQVLYKYLNLNTKLEISKTIDCYADVVQIFEKYSLTQMINNSEIEAYLERIFYLNDPISFSSVNKKFGNKFEKTFRYCHALISNNASASLIDIKQYFNQLNYKEMNHVELSKIHQLEMLAASAVDTSEESKDYIIELSNKNISANLKTENSFDFIRAFIVSILVTKDLDLANYIKEGFYNNGSITKADIKQLSRFFVSYGEFIEKEQKLGASGSFEQQMKNLIISDIINRI